MEFEPSPYPAPWLAAFTSHIDANYEAQWLAGHLQRRMRVHRVLNPFGGGQAPIIVWAISYAVRG